MPKLKESVSKHNPPLNSSNVQSNRAPFHVWVNIANERKNIRRLYLLALFLFVIVVVFTIIALSTGNNQIIFTQEISRILYAILSLAIAIVTFGLIGDSEALLEGKLHFASGFLVQVTGSAVGFIAFFWLLTSGLQPFHDVTLYLYDGNKPFDSDDRLTLTLTGNGDRFTYFQYDAGRSSTVFHAVPKNTEPMLHITGGGWRIAQIKPENCVSDMRNLKGDCNHYHIHLQQTKNKLSTIEMLYIDAHEVSLTLEQALRDLMNRIQNASMPNATYKFSPQVDTHSTAIREYEFTLHRQAEVARTVCSHILDILHGFHASQNTVRLKAYLTNNKIVILTLDEETPMEAEVVECQ